MKYQLTNIKSIYPQDIQCVFNSTNGKGSIYIGNIQASQNIITLKKYGIKAILTASRDTILKHTKQQIPYYLYIPGQDHDKFNMKKYFQQSINFIHNSLQSTNILVHCIAGISRSVTLVLAYLIKFYQMSFYQAFLAVKSKRKIINPNHGFIQQLQQFQRNLKIEQKLLRKSLGNNDYKSLGNSQVKHSKTNLNQSILKQCTNKSYQPSPHHKQQKQIKNDQHTQQQIKNIKPPQQTKNKKVQQFTDINKQLDKKLMEIKKKYLQASRFINKLQQNRKSKSKNKYQSFINHTLPFYSTQSKFNQEFNQNVYSHHHQKYKKNISHTQYHQEFFNHKTNTNHHLGNFNSNLRKIHTFKRYNF